MTLWLVGLGISGRESVPDATSGALSMCDVVYLETFTSPDIDTTWIREVNPNVIQAKRWMVEDGKRILDDARNRETALVSYGDPLVATTHTDLLVRAAAGGIPTRVVHASSAVSSIVGQCGLHHYKMGRMATIMDDAKSLSTPYYVTYRNAVRGSHTLLLLEYNQDGGFFLDPAGALDLLLKTETGQNRGVFTPSSFCIVASRVGLPDQTLISGNISSMVRRDFGPPPHSIIVPGGLHFTERDALLALTQCVDEPPPEDTYITSIPQQMLRRYIPMIHKSISEIQVTSENVDIIQNAQLYVQDAERALDSGQDEVAVLSIGYADGLVDAIRIMKGMDPKL